jgi:beta-galactosidase
MVLRSNQPDFTEAAGRWLKRLGQELAPLQIARGGPIIAVQVENEYGSFDTDKQYLTHIRDLLVAAGFGETLMYTADGPEELSNGTLPDLPAAVNFGPGDAHHAFEILAKFRPAQPLLAGEYWDGWFDSWGLERQVTNAALEERELDWMLSQGYSVNLYMFHGGTTFGFMNGANYQKSYVPQTTSYDYDAPLDESGRPTPKYFAFREIIARHLPANNLPAVPSSAPAIAIAPMGFTEGSSLWESLGTPVEADLPRPMEELGQSYGYILYRTRIAGPVNGQLRIDPVHDYAEIYVNGKNVGTLDRRLGQNALTIQSSSSRATLDILVENTGRINFGKLLRGERKGVTHTVMLAGRELHEWQIYSLPMSDVGTLRFRKNDSLSGPAFYRAQFSVSQPYDTFLDMRECGKGVAWVNGHMLGRFWNIGPQRTLYVPRPWLRSGENEVVIFELKNQRDRTIQGLKTPILDQLNTSSPQ